MTVIVSSPANLAGTGLYVGDITGCASWGPLIPTSGGGEEPWAGVVHACKNPCHSGAVGTRTLRSDRHEYLSARRGETHLYLNIIDPDAPLFRHEVFQAALAFIDERIPRGPVLVHCNQGVSRAPSIALLWLAKRTKVLDKAATFQDARASFVAGLYPAYAPGQGIVTFLTEWWERLA